jgi:hypothetical protein
MIESLSMWDPASEGVKIRSSMKHLEDFEDHIVHKDLQSIFLREIETTRQELESVGNGQEVDWFLKGQIAHMKDCHGILDRMMAEKAIEIGLQTEEIEEDA